MAGEPNDLEIKIGFLLGDDSGETLAEIRENFKRTFGEFAKLGNDPNVKRASAAAGKTIAKGVIKGSDETFREMTKGGLAGYEAYLKAILQASRRVHQEATDENRNRLRKDHTKFYLDEKLIGEKELADQKSRNHLALQAQKSADTQANASHSAALRDRSRTHAEHLKALNQAAKTGQALYLQNRKAGDAKELVDIKEQAAKRLDTYKTGNKQIIVDAREASTLRVEAAREANRAQAREESRQEAQRREQARQSMQQESLDRRTAAARELQDQKQADRLLFNAEQEASARRIARRKAYYNVVTSLARSGAQAANNALRAGLTASVNIVQAALIKRVETHRRKEAERLSVTQASLYNESTMIRAQLERQNAAYSAAAQRRLARIEQAAAKERSVITRNAVKQAEAQVAAQRELQTGVLGATVGRSGIGAGGIAGVLGGGLAGRRIYETLADFQSIETAFRGIFEEVEGKAPRTTAFLKEMQSFAKSTPFSLRSLSEYAQKFFANKLVDPESPKAVDELKKKLLLLADAAAATGKTQTQIEGGVLGITQISASGRLSLEDLRQVTEGVGIRLEDVAKELGLTTGQLFKAMEKGAIGAEDGLNAIFTAMSKIPGAAGASARQAGNLRGAISNLQDVIDQIIVKAFAPLGVYIAKGISGFAEFAGKILDGKGAYELARRAIAGIAIALGSVIAAKGAIQVLRLAGLALKVIAANPVVLGVAALGTAIALLPRLSPGVARFFSSLVDGFRIVGKAGYDLKSPIEGLSNIVLLQSSLGAAARVFKDFFDDVSFGFALWRKGLGTSGITGALEGFLADIRRTLGPARGAIVQYVEPMVEEVREYLAGVRINVGSFLLPALGLTGGDGGFVSRTLRSFISKVFLGGIVEMGTDTPAAAMGEKANEIVTAAFAKIKDAGVNVAAFFAALFGGEVDLAVPASELGGALNTLVAEAFSRVGERIGPIGDFFAKIGGAIAGWWGKFVIPKLIDIPRVLGRGLAKIVFSEEFIKGLVAAAAALAGAAALIAVQFIRGFAEGLWERRGDILKAVLDILGFVAKAIGVPRFFVVAIAAGLAAAFTASRVLGGIARLRNTWRIATAAMTGDAGIARKAIADIARVERPPTSSGLANVILGDRFQATLDGAHRAAVRTRGAFVILEDRAKRFAVSASTAFRAPGAAIEDLGKRIQRMQGLVETSNGRVRSLATGRFVADPRKDLGAARLAIGRFFEQAGQTVTEGTRRLSVASSRAWDGLKRGTRSAIESVKSFGASLADPEQRMKRVEQAVAVGTAAISGYMAGMAEDGQSQMLALSGTLVGVAGAFAVGGPVLGGIAAVASAVGFVWGQNAKETQRANAEAKKQAEELKATAKSVRDSFGRAFDEIGSTRGSAREQAVFKVFSEGIAQDEAAVRQFTTLFGGSVAEVAEAAGKGREALDTYTAGLKGNVMDAFLNGSRQASEDIGKKFPRALKLARTEMSTLAVELARSGKEAPNAAKAILDLTGDLHMGRMTFAEYRQALDDAGVSTESLARLTAAYTQAVEEGVDATAGGEFIKVVGREMDKAVKQYREANRLQDTFNFLLEQGETAATRFSAAWGRVKESLDKAAGAYRDWLDATRGGQRTRDEAIVSILGAARDAGQPGPDGETRTESEARRRLAVLSEANMVADQLAQIWKNSNGDVTKFNAEVGKFFDELRGAAPNQEAVNFINEVQQIATEQGALDNIFKSAEPVKGVEEIRTKLSDMIELAKVPIPVKVQSGDAEARAEFLKNQLIILASQDATVRAYIDDEGFQDVYEELLEQRGLLDGSAITVWTNLRLRLQEGIRSVGEQISLAIQGAFGARRWGGAHEVARWGRVPAHVASNPTILYGERETGGEAMIPRFGNLGRSEAIARVAAGWLGGRFVSRRELRRLRGVIPMASGGIVGPLASVSPSSAGMGPTIHHEVNVEQKIYETTSPRRTAIDTVRGIRSAKFLGGQTAPVGAFA